MKKVILFSTIISAILVCSCSKNNSLPPYTPPVAVNFSVSSLNHTKDTVNVGDTIYLTATGVMYDTTQNIYAYLAASASVGGVGMVYNYGSSASPVKLSRTIGAQNNGLYSWTSNIMFPGATFVPPSTKLTITANFIYQLTLSSEQGTLSATDAGVANKTVFVQ